MFSDPVFGKDFFDRKEIVELINKRVESFKRGYRQNIALLGQRFIGKSSIIYQYLFKFNNPDLIPIYIEIDKTDFIHFVDKFILTLLYQFLKSTDSDININDNLELLIKRIAKTTPDLINAVKKIQDLIDKAELVRAYEELFELPNLIKIKTNKQCIIILDEFDRLETFKEIDNPFGLLGKKIMVQKDVLYIVVSSDVDIARQILSEKLSLLFGNFEVLDIKKFDFSTSIGFLNYKFPTDSISDKLKRFLIYLCDGYPFYLDAVSSELVSSLNKDTKITSSTIVDVLAKLLFNSRGILNQYFTNLLNDFIDAENISVARKILMGVVNDTRPASIAKTAGLGLRDIYRWLNRFEKKTFVTKCGTLYIINDTLFKFWIQMVYLKKDFSFTNILLEKDFRIDLETRISKFVSGLKRDPYDKLIELLNSFENEIVQLENKNFKFFQLDDIKAKIIGNNGPYVLAKTSYNKYWVFQIRDKQVVESDILEFDNDCKKLRLDVQRKILIALDSIDINAKLLANETKIWLWNLANFNTILDLYRKEKIVRC